MLEKMDKFFEARLSGYDEHILNKVEAVSNRGATFTVVAKR